MTILRVICADIRKEKGLSEAVVNAANEDLVLGRGIAEALKKACGPQLQVECNEFLRDMNATLNMAKVPTGSLALTDAYTMHPCAGKINH